MARKIILTQLLIWFLVITMQGTAAGSEVAGTLHRDRTIFVPEEAFDAIFRDAGTGIFLSYKEYRDLWKKANMTLGQPGPKQGIKPDFSHMTLLLVPDKDAMLCVMLLYIGNADTDNYLAAVPFKHPFVLARFIPGDPAPSFQTRSADIGGLTDAVAARLITKHDKTYLLCGKNQPGNLVLTYSMPVTYTGKTGKCAVSIPDIPLQQIAMFCDMNWELSSPEILGLQTVLSKSVEASHLNILYLKPGTSTLNLTWRPRLDKVEHTGRISCSMSSTVKPLDDLLEFTTTCSAKVLRGDYSALRFSLPSGSVIRKVSNPHVLFWQLEQLSGHSVLEIHFQQNVQSMEDISIEYVVPLHGGKGMTTFFLPALETAQPLDGSIHILPGRNISVFPLNTERLEHVSSGTETSILSFSYNQPGQQFTLEYFPLRSQGYCYHVSQSHLEDGVARVKTIMDLQFYNKPVYNLLVDMPEGFVPTEVGAIQGRKWLLSWEQQAETPTLSIRIPGELGDAESFQLIINGDISFGKLNRVALPVFIPHGFDEWEGLIAVTSNGSYTIGDEETTGLYPVGYNALSSRIPGLSEADFIAGYEYNLKLAKGSTTIIDAETSITVDSLTSLNIDRKRMLFDARLAYTLKGAGARTLEFSLPYLTGEKISITGKGIREKKIVKSDEQNGDHWKIEFSKPVRGQYILDINFDIPIPETGLIDYRIPEIQPFNVEREIGFVVIEAGTELELDITQTRLNETNPHEIPDVLKDRLGTRILKCFRYFEHPHELTVSTKIHDDLSVLAAVINSAHASTKIHETGSVVTELRYIIQSKNLQFLDLELPENSRVWSALVNNIPVKPFLFDGKSRVPLLVSGVFEQAKNVTLVYETRIKELHGGSKVHQVLPLTGVPVLQTTWNVYYPDDYVPVYAAGDFPGWTQGGPRPDILSASLPAQVGSLFARGLGSSVSTLMVSREKSASQPDIQYAPSQTRDMRQVPAAELKKLESLGHVTEGREYAGIAGEQTYMDSDMPAAAPPAEKKPADGSLGLLSMAVNVEFTGPYYSFSGTGSDRETQLKLVRSDRLRRVRWICILSTAILGLVLRKKYKVHPVLYLVVVFGIAHYVLNILIMRGTTYSHFIKDGLFLFLMIVIVLFIQSHVRQWRDKMAVILVLIIVPGMVFASEEIPPTVTPTPGSGVTIFVPYSGEQPGDTIPDENRIFISEHDFKSLWVSAYPDATPSPVMVPADYVLSEATYTGTVEDNRARFTMHTRIHVLKQGWCLVSLDLSNVMFTDILVDNKVVPVTLEDGVPFLTLKGPGEFDMELQFSTPVTGEITQGSISFGIPYIAAARLVLNIPCSPVDVSLSDKSSLMNRNFSKPGISKITAALGGQTKAEISWQKIADSMFSNENSPGTPAGNTELLVSMTQEQACFLGPAWSFTHSNVSVNVSGPPIQLLHAAVPETWSILRVTGPVINSWIIDGSDLAIQFNSAMDGTFQFVVEMEQQPEKINGHAVEPLKFPDAYRSEGTLLVAIPAKYGIENLAQERLHRIDKDALPVPSILPGKADDYKTVAGYRFSDDAWSLEYSISETPLRATVKNSGLYKLGPDRFFLETTLQYEVEEGEIVETLLKYPAEMEIHSVQVMPPQVFMHNITRNEHTDYLHIYYRQAISGNSTKIVINSSYEYGMDLRELKTVDLNLPVIRVEDFPSSTYQLQVFEGQGLQTVIRDKKGFNEWKCPPGREGVEYSCFKGFDCDDPERLLGLTLMPMDGKVRSVIVQHYVVDEDVIQAQLLITYEILEGAVKTFMFECPKDLASGLQISGDNIRKKFIAGTSSSEELSRWEIVLHEAAVNFYTLKISYAVPSGYEKPVSIAPVTPLYCKELHGYIILENTSPGELKVEKTEGLSEALFEKIPFVHQEIRRNRVVEILQYGETPWQLEMKLAQLKQEETLAAVVDYIHIETVISHKGEVRNRFLCHMQNQAEQYLEIELPGNAEVWGALVNGNPVKPVFDADKPRTVLIPIIRTSPADQAFDTEIYYVFNDPTMLKNWSKLDYTVPVLKNIPVSKTLWTLWLPPNKRYTKFGGNIDRASEYDLEAEKVISLVDEQSRLLKAIDQMEDYEKNIAIGNVQEIETRFNSLFDKVQRQGSRRKTNEDLERARQQFFQNQIITQQQSMELQTQEERQSMIETEWNAQEPASKIGKKFQQSLQQQQSDKIYPGTIRGSVKDTDGNSLAGVTVVFKSAAYSTSYQTMTNYLGEYIYAGLPPDTYLLTITKDNYQQQDIKTVHLSKNQVIIANLTMIPSNRLEYSKRDDSAFERSKRRYTGESGDELDALIRARKEYSQQEKIPGMSAKDAEFRSDENEQEYQVDGKTDPFSGMLTTGQSAEGDGYSKPSKKPDVEVYGEFKAAEEKSTGADNQKAGEPHDVGEYLPEREPIAENDMIDETASHLQTYTGTQTTDTKEAGIFSMKIEFPRTGYRFDFKKLKGDAELEISFRDVKASKKTGATLMVLVLIAAGIIIYKRKLLARFTRNN